MKTGAHEISQLAALLNQTLLRRYLGYVVKSLNEGRPLSAAIFTIAIPVALNESREKKDPSVLDPSAWDSSAYCAEGKVVPTFARNSRKVREALATTCTLLAELIPNNPNRKLSGAEAAAIKLCQDDLAQLANLLRPGTHIKRYLDEAVTVLNQGEMRLAAFYLVGALLLAEVKSHRLICDPIQTWANAKYWQGIMRQQMDDRSGHHSLSLKENRAVVAACSLLANLLGYIYCEPVAVTAGGKLRA